MINRLFTISILLLLISFLVFIPGCAEAVFEVSNLTVSPQDANTGQRVTITVDIINTGGAVGTYTAILKIGGVETDQHSITVSPGRTEQATFSLTKETSGNYIVDVNGLTAILTVSELKRPGWTVLTTEKFKILLPEDWIEFEISPETIDAIIEEMGETNPALVPYLEAAKNQEAIKLWACDMTLTPTFPVNIIGGYEIRLIRSLDKYVEMLEKQYESLGITVSLGDKFSLRGDEALIIEMRGVGYYPSGESFQYEQQTLLVDNAGYRYLICLTYPPEYDEKYEELFDQIIQTFRVIE